METKPTFDVGKKQSGTPNFVNSKIVYWETVGGKKMKSWRNVFGRLDTHVQLDRDGREKAPYYNDMFR